MYALENFKKNNLFICPKCCREIRNCYSKFHAFNVQSGDDDKNGVMCAYCYFDEYAYDFMKYANEFEVKFPGFFLKKLEIKSQKDFEDMLAAMTDCTYETMQKCYNVDPDELFDEYALKVLFTLSSDMLSEFRGIPPEANFVQRAEAYLNFHGEVKTIGLRLVRTDNNTAIIYQHDFDPEFLSNNGHCPYYDYYMAREVADRFTVLDSEEDLIYRLKALKTIKEWENTGEFDAEIKSLEDKIIQANGKLPDSPETESYADKIETEILDKITGTPERIMAAPSDDRKLDVINEYKKLIDDIKEDKYNYDGKVLDLGEIISDEIAGLTLSQNFYMFFEFGYNTLNHAYVMFEEWKLTKNEASLIECLSNLEMRISLVTRICPEISYESELPESDNPVFKPIKIMIDRFIYFYQAYKKRLNEFRNTGILKRLDSFKSSNLLQSYSGYDENTLSNESLAVYTVNLIEPLTFLQNILLLVKNHYDELYNDTKDSQVLKISNMLTDSAGEFKNYFDKLIDIFYVSRNAFLESAEREQSKPSGSKETVRILKQLGEMLKSLRNAGSIADIFEVKKSYFAQITTDESIYEEIEKILDIIVSILNDRCTDQTEYQQIYNSVKNELSEKKAVLSDSVTKTLATAEYLYKKFIIEAEDDPTKDYSCISVMYYRALEDALNTLIYIPYREQVLYSNVEILKNLYYMQDQRNTFLPPKLTHFFESIFDENGRFAGIELKDRIMLGNFVKMFASLRHLTGFSSFLSRQFRTARLDFYMLNQFRADLDDASEHRNRSAHGGQIISRVTAEEDKSYVYAKDSAGRCKKLLIRLLDFFN